jgi:AraC family transcriptional regulator
VLAGGYEETFGQRVRRAEAGTVIVHPEGEHHAERHDPLEARLLTVEFAARELDVLRPVLRVFDESWHRRDDRFLGLAGRLRAELGRRDAASALVVESTALEMLAALGRVRISETRGARWLLRVRERLDASDASGEVPNMRALSSLAGVHPVYLARAFRRTYGCSVGEFVRLRRVGRALSMLESEALPLAAVAREAGFADQSHMTRQVHAQTGLTPGEWRRRRSS